MLNQQRDRLCLGLALSFQPPPPMLESGGVGINRFQPVEKGSPSFTLELVLDMFSENFSIEKWRVRREEEGGGEGGRRSESITYYFSTTKEGKDQDHQMPPLTMSRPFNVGKRASCVAHFSYDIRYSS